MPFEFREPRPYALIAPEEAKGAFYALRQAHPRLDVSFYTAEDVLKLYGRSSDSRAVRALLEKGVSYAFSKDLLEAFSAPFFERTSSKKLLPYKDLREELIEKDLLLRTPFPGRSFEGKHILFEGYGSTALLSELISGSAKGMIMADFAPSERNERPIASYYAFKTVYEEFHALSNAIAAEIDAGTSPEDIWVYGVDDPKLQMLLAHFASAYGFSVDGELASPLSADPSFWDFLENYEASEDLQKAYEAHLLSHPDVNIGNFMEEAIALLDPIKPLSERLALLKEIAKGKKVPTESLHGAVHLAKGFYAPRGVKAFAVNFSMGSFPPSFKDEGFLDSKERHEIGLFSAEDHNLDASYQIERLLHSPNLRFLSFHENRFGDPRILSALAEVYGIKKYEDPETGLPYPKERFEYSHTGGSYLLASLLDHKKDFGIEDDRIPSLSGIALQKDLYRDYEPRFKGKLPGIGKKEGKPYALSPTSFSKWVDCPFEFLCTSFLKLDPNEDSFAIRLGNVFHKVLERHAQDPERSHHDLYQEACALEREKVPFSAKEEFLLSHLEPYSKKGLAMMDEVEGQLSSYGLRRFPEGSFSIPYNEELSLTGKYDKVATFKLGGERYLMVVDYKTGAASKAFNPARFAALGQTPQLPFYAYYALHSKEYEDAKIAGLWIAPLLSMDFAEEKKGEFSLCDQKNMKLRGIALDDPTLYTAIGDFEKGTSLLYGLRLSAKGWYKGTPVYSEDAFKKDVAGRLEPLFEEALASFKEGDFPIRPLRFRNADACQNCAMRDLCYRPDTDEFRVRKFNPADYGLEDSSEERDDDFDEDDAFEEGSDNGMDE